MKLNEQNFAYHSEERLWNLFGIKKVNQWTKIPQISEKKLIFF